MDKRSLKKVVRIEQILAECYGRKVFLKTTDPLTELVLTVLSQNTNDVNRDRAFNSMKEKYPDWEDVMNSSQRQLAAAIRVGGLADTKSRRIIKMLKSIKAEHGNLNLNFFENWPDDKISEYLLDIDGVGPKTVACVLAFAMGRDVMPVDTHVHRVSKRLALISPGMSAEKAHDFFRQLKGIVSLYQFHLNLITHGRTLCKAQKPLCAECKLRRLCKHYAETTKNKGQAA